MMLTRRTEMQLRYHMNTNDGRLVEMPAIPAGMEYLKGLRRGRSDLFKHQRITEILQAKPSEVAVGVLHTFS